VLTLAERDGASPPDDPPVASSAKAAGLAQAAGA
jgi:hypothetical protein